jgi:uncharacterized membrane protein YhhN
MELKLILLVIFAVFSVLYLTSLFFKRGLFNKIMKGCILPFILVFYILNAKIILIPIILGLFFVLIGDILLLKIDDVRFFRIGLASFLIGHICYIIAMYGYALPLHIPALVCSIAAAAALGIFIYKVVRPTPEMKIPIIVYELVIFVMAAFALQLFLSKGGYFGGFVLAGSICFVFSDGMLAYDTFREKTKWGYFFVMLTYILAQLFITLGFCYAG